MDTLPEACFGCLGITWDSARGTIETVDKRVAKIISTIDNIIVFDFVLSARRLRRLASL